MPKRVINAFLAAEDKNFYEHGGLDFIGIARAAVNYVENYGSGRHPQGASTITQQVAKNFLLTNKVTFTRKIKEALLALKIERTYSKDKILELYLNEIYLGLGAYGIAAASLTYFDKGVNELTIAAGGLSRRAAEGAQQLPSVPPARPRDRAPQLGDRPDGGRRLHHPGAGRQGQAHPLGVVQKPPTQHMFAAEYFAEEVRRELYDRYGEKKLYEGGLSVRTTLDPKLQMIARKALVRRAGRATTRRTATAARSAKIDLSRDWGPKLADVKALADVAPWRLAVVLEVGDKSARIGLQPGREPGGFVSKERKVGIIPLDGVKWAKVKGRTPRKVSDVLAPGDVIYVEPTNDQGQYALRQVPKVSGAHRGRGPLDRPRARHGRRLLLRRKPVQPRDAGAAPAGLLVQADRLRRRPRQRLHAVDAGARRADRDRPGPGPRRLEAGELRARFLRPLDAALRRSSIRAT